MTDRSGQHRTSITALRGSNQGVELKHISLEFTEGTGAVRGRGILKTFSSNHQVTSHGFEGIGRAISRQLVNQGLNGGAPLNTVGSVAAVVAGPEGC